ncbi:50S ribosomal protein L10 [Candidatus Wolfebacteria bacterium]|nr:50S ribosomal protein L10 [Candidatus Wolfebacteria bacterium]
MAVTKQKKQEVVAKLKDILSKAESVTFVNFHGLGVSGTALMRSALKQEGVGYMVAKKTLIKLALGGVKAEGDVPALPGELAIAYGAETAPAREVYAFQKRYEDKVSILGGIFEGRYLDKEAMLAIAQIPSLQVLRGMFVNVINSPIQGLAVALNEIARSKN